jgi:hypothetical protein
MGYPDSRKWIPRQHWLVACVMDWLLPRSQWRSGQPSSNDSSNQADDDPSRAEFFFVAMSAKAALDSDEL